VSEELEQALAESTTQIIEWMEQAGGFVAEQAPDVVQQFLAWKFYANCAWGATFALVFLALTALGIFCFVADERSHKSGYYDEAFASAGTFSWFCALGSLIISVFFWVAVAKIQVAPKLVVLEYLRGLL
jgi:hypothetical protein